MLGAIAGDIVGSRFEGEPAPQGDFALFHPQCQFTDDTICTLAVADALLGDRDFAASLRAFVQVHPRRGYGGMFLNWAFAEDAPAYGSWGNGAPMRVAAVGWLARDEAQALDWAEAQSIVTHNHPDAVAGAQAVALAILLARSGAPRADIRRRIIADFGYDLTPERAWAGGGFDVSAAGTVPPALTAALETDSWEAAVRTVICLGGDTDTLACIAGSVAEAIHGLPPDIADTAQRYLTPDLTDVIARFAAATHR
ncbi:MAG TPA: ADP-ribosylglycohydrolase family protein [Vineibacter sp.]|nr:ADP-ribosylglycohydrolase family protein [Vineibacter sp.]